MRHTGTASWRSMTGRLSIPFYTISRCASTLVVCVKLMLVLTSLFDADNSSASNDVMLLTTKNFDVVAADTKHLFVQFFAHWCRQCKSLESEFNQVATSLHGSDIRLAKVDGTVETNLVERFQITGFPTLKLFSPAQTKPVDYNGERTARHIINWLLRKTDPGVKQVHDVATISRFVDNELIVVLGLFSNDSELREQKSNAFLRAADAAGDDLIRFLISGSQSVFHQYNITSDSALVLFRQLDGIKLSLRISDWSPRSLLDVIRRNLLPPVVEFSRDASRLIQLSNIVDHVLLFTTRRSDNDTSAVDAFTQTATEFQGQMLFIVLDVDDEDVPRILTIVDDSARRDALPLIYFVQSDSTLAPSAAPRHKYRLDARTATTTVISQFIHDVLGGKIKAFVKSEAEVDGLTSRSVRVLTGSNFESVVRHSGSHVIVLFYAAWCVHCQRLTPVWHQLADMYADSDDVIVAQIDVTANDVPGVEINAFPTIKLYDKDGHTVVNYLEEKTIDKLQHFVNGIVSRPPTAELPASAAATRGTHEDL